MKYEDFMSKIKNKFPEEDFEVLQWGKSSNEISIIKCLNCGREISINTGELFRKRRTKICSKCNYIRKDTLKNREIIKRKIGDKGYLIDFFMEKQSQNGNRGDKVRFTCTKCERVNEFFVTNLIKNDSDIKCQYCSGQKNKKDHIAYKMELEEKYPHAFTLLSDYKDVNKEIKVKCNECGFIRFIKPNNLIRNGYCPKCSNNKSLGEKKVREYLDQRDIKYEQQKYFKDWNIGIHYFDFYLPEFNLVIEYNGIQHYEFNPYFHRTKENFSYLRERDTLKKNSAINNGINYLSIKYTLFHKINDILDNIFQGSTTIPNGSRGKCLEMESFSRREEDIVWT